MARKHQYLCVFYGLIASVALMATWSQNLAYAQSVHGLGDIPAAIMQFVIESRVNPATRSISLDILLLALAASAFMIFEARRLGIRFVWAYVALSFLLAVSVTVPLFLITRERHLAWHEGAGGPFDEEPTPVTDGVGLAVVSVLVLLVSGFVIAG